MKLFIFFTIILVCSSFLVSKRESINYEKNKKHLFYEGALVNIYIDKMLYISKEESFLNKITIENKTNNELGIDLRNYWKVIYPNQYGKLVTPERTVIDERNIVPDTLNQKKRDELKALLNSKKLALISARGSIEYYREFNGGKKEQVLLNKGEFLFISFDGQLFITDGDNNFEHVFVINNKLVHTDLILEYPVKWGNISNKGAIIKKN